MKDTSSALPARPASSVRQIFRRFNITQFWERKPLVGLVSYLRWAIPIAVSFVGIAYVLFEDIIIQGNSVTTPSVIRTILVIGLAGPVLVWVSLTWAARAAMAEATAQKELALRNQEARRRVARLQIASQIGQRMTALLDLNTLLTEVVRLIRVRYGYHHVGIFLVDAERAMLVLREVSGTHNEVHLTSLEIPNEETNTPGWVAQTGRPLLINDVSDTTQPRSPDLDSHIRARLAVPLRVGKRVIGVLDAQSDRVNAFIKEDLIVLEILGNQLGIAIENARLFQETKSRYEAMIALHETSLDMIAQLNRDSLLQALLRRSAQLLNANASSLYLYDPEHDLIYHAAGYNNSRDFRGVTLKPGEGLVGRVIQSGQTMIENDYEHWAGRVEIFSGTVQTRVISVPLRWHNQIIGGINVSNQAEARPFVSEDVWLLGLFADLASIAIKNSELHTQAKNFSLELESKVAERTRELSYAQDEIIAKAEQLSSLLAKTIDLQENERARIARDMHDGVVQLITAARFELQAIKVVTADNLPPIAQSKLTATREVLEEAEVEIRRAIYDLHSPILDAMGLVPALEKHTNRFRELAGIDCTIIVNGTPCRLPINTEVAVFRMVEEALNNAAAHSGGTMATILIDYAPDTVTVSVQDNGHGFDYHDWFENRHSGHLGLLSMQERANNLGGEIQVWSMPHQGTHIRFRLPIHSAHTQ